VDLEGLYNFPDDSRMTLVVEIMNASGIEQFNLLPAYINNRAQPRLLEPEEPLFAKVTDYLRQICLSAHLNGQCVQRGGRLALMR